MPRISFLLCLVLIAAMAGPAAAQTSNLIEKVDLSFSLAADPTRESVGFDNAKARWQLEYELYLTESKELEKLGRCHRDEGYKFICPLDPPKKVIKKIKKTSLRVAGEKIVRQGPFDGNEVEVAFPVQLSPEIIEIFNKAVTTDANPTFVLMVKTKASVRAGDKRKFKGKETTNGVYPLKFYNADKTFNDYWNITKMGLSFSIRRSSDGSLLGLNIYRI